MKETLKAALLATALTACGEPKPSQEMEDHKQELIDLRDQFNGLALPRSAYKATDGERKRDGSAGEKKREVELAQIIKKREKLVETEMKCEGGKRKWMVVTPAKTNEDKYDGLEGQRFPTVADEDMNYDEFVALTKTRVAKCEGTEGTWTLTLEGEWEHVTDEEVASCNFPWNYAPEWMGGCTEEEEECTPTPDDLKEYRKELRKQRKDKNKDSDTASTKE
ncbi:hypothetical protein KKC94_05950 [Patescibacteria group bacterium]|nr:hypothetical protein [Patescibacteria group bacterium]